MKTTTIITALLLTAISTTAQVRFGYGFFNTCIGNSVSHIYNMVGAIDNVTELDGVLALSGATKSGSTLAFTIGIYSLGPSGYVADWRDHLFVHEYGHYIQSRYLGILYLPIIGRHSLLSTLFTSSACSQSHHDRWFEVNASKLGAKHFDRKYGRGRAGFKTQSADYFQIDLFRSGNDTPYVNPRSNDYEQSEHPTSNPVFNIFDIIP